MRSTWISAQDAEGAVKSWEIHLQDTQSATDGERILNRAFNHLLLDSEDNRPLRAELIVFAEALARVQAVSNG